jgi:hypothetical protein
VVIGDDDRSLLNDSFLPWKRHCGACECCECCDVITRHSPASLLSLTSPSHQAALLSGHESSLARAGAKQNTLVTTRGVLKMRSVFSRLSP